MTQAKRIRDPRAARYGINEYFKQGHDEPCGWVLRLGNNKTKPWFDKVFHFEEFGGKIKALKVAQAKRSEVLELPEFKKWIEPRLGGRNDRYNDSVTGVRGVNYSYINRKVEGEDVKMPVLMAQDTGKKLGQWAFNKYDPKTAFFRAVRKRDTVEVHKHTHEEMQTLYEAFIENVHDELMDLGIDIPV